MSAIRDAFERYGWRRMQAALRQQGLVVNHKKVKRLMREHDLQPRMRRRYVATTSSDHDHPIFRNLAKDRVVNGANQLWVADITYVAVTTGFVYVAVILDAWSRRVVGYAISRSIDVRLTLAALNAAIEDRRPPAGCLHHSDRGSQYAAQAYRQALDSHGLVGSMGRRGNPYDNAKAESFMKTLKVEAVYPMAYETVSRRRRRPSTLHQPSLQQPQAPLSPRLSEPQTVRGPPRPADSQISGLIPVRPQGPTPCLGQFSLEINNLAFPCGQELITRT